MKKVFMSLAVFASSLVASAQVYLGGELSLWRDYSANKTNVEVTPEIGYKLSDTWDIGTSIGYGYNYNGTTVGNDANNVKTTMKTNSFVVAPYARYTYLKLGQVDLFLEGGFGFRTYKNTNEVITTFAGHETSVKDKGEAQNAWEVGIKPGLAVNLTPKLSFIAHVGFLGYRDADDNTEVWGSSNGIGLKLNASDVKFGLVYNF